MTSVRKTAWICSRCLRHQERFAQCALPVKQQRRAISSSSPHHAEGQSSKQDDDPPEEPKQGALSRRLSEMAEETMDTGSKSDRKLMQDMPFSDDLKRQLEERITQTAFKADNQQALSQADLPSYAGKGTADQSAARPWQGTESTEDAALRMLNDAHKKLRAPIRAPRIPQPVNLRPSPKSRISAADRLAKARDKTSMYAFSQQDDMTEDERNKFRKELKERFTPGARPMPTTLQGLTSLANERIEDAIARGQFRNIQRGKGVNTERDYNANSPFLDTTEYFMNKIIQKQEIVPPWIEKQQELVKMVNNFRARLRSDWRRHAARMIAANGGTVDEQVRKARGYALAEEIVNPRQAKKNTMTGISSDGTLSTITVEERIAAGVVDEDQQDSPPEVEIQVTESSAEASPLQAEPIQEATATMNLDAMPPASTNASARPRDFPVLPMAHPFRDTAWEKTENAYHTLAVAELNNLTRSYNLMAPKIAQRPYYSLDRELRRCFADVAVSLPEEILERSRKPLVKISVIGHKEGGVMEKFGAGDWKGHQAERIRDEGDEKAYSFKEFFRDLFRRNEKRRQPV